MPHINFQFKFFDPETTRAQLIPAVNARISSDDIIGQTDPFYAECRAYGRIQQRKRKIPIAVPCHGFITIPATVEPELARRFGASEWDHQESELVKPLLRRKPFRALVKELVEEEPDVTESLIKRMLKDLRALHSLGIYVMDVKIENYVGGKLVDFSVSCTEPHHVFRDDLRSEDDIRALKNMDYDEFDAMISELGVETKVRASMMNFELVHTVQQRQRKAKLQKTPN
jgi:hypothetical protein